MKSILLLSLLIFAAPLSATTVEADAEESYTSSYVGAGVTAGATSGIGLTHKYHSAMGLGYQLTLGAFGTPQDLMAASVGTQATYTFASIRNARIYGLTGVGTFFNRTVMGEWDMCNWNEDTGREENCIHIPETVTYGAIANLGIGLGIEIILWDTVGLSFDLPLSTSIGLGSHHGLEFLGVFPIPNLSLLYYF